MKGLKIPKNKELSLNKKIEKIDTKYLYFVVPDDYKILVSKNTKVKINTILAVSDNNTSIISSVSGKVIECDNIIKIENDYKENIKKIDTKNITKQKFVEMLKDSGIKGMGGAGFPTYKKYQNEINTLIVNAVECEPFKTADYTLVSIYAQEIIDTIKKIMEINNIEKTIITVKKHNYDIDKFFKPYLTDNITLHEVKDIYPAGWGKYLIKETLNLNYDKHASELGVVVNNVATIYAIKKLFDGIRLDSRIVTITGDTNKNGNYIIKIGTDIKEIIDTNNLIIGGPMMGKKYNNDFVTPTTSCLLVLNDDKTKESICLRCGKCINVCPVGIEPVLIKDNINNKDKLKQLRPNKCISCGLCSYICPAKINLRDIVNQAKGR